MSQARTAALLLPLQLCIVVLALNAGAFVVVDHSGIAVTLNLASKDVETVLLSG